MTDPDDFLLLNDAFAVDPLVVDVAPGASRRATRSSWCTWCSGAGGEAVFPRTVDPGRSRFDRPA